MASRKSGNNKNAIKNELININNFQESQIKALESIADALSTTLISSVEVKDSLKDIHNMLKSVSDTLSKSAQLNSSLSDLDEEIGDSVEGIKTKSTTLNNSIDSVIAGFSNLTKALRHITSQVNNYNPNSQYVGPPTVNTNNYNTNNSSQGTSNTISAIFSNTSNSGDTSDPDGGNGNSGGGISKSAIALGILRKILSHVSDISKRVADTANNYSQISNDLISVSGGSGASVRSTRSAIVQDIVAQLNTETGMFFDPEESYMSIVNAAQSAGVGNLEEIQEISRPLLLATESMSVSTQSMTSLLNKWYTQYHFSAIDMESMIDEIRGYTAGNNATAEATLENIAKFQDFMSVYSENPEDMIKAIAEETSRAESVGMDYGQIADLLYQIGTGDVSNMSQIAQILAYSGSGLTYTDVENMLRSGTTDEYITASDALIKGKLSIGNKLKDRTLSAEAARAMGFSYDELLNMMAAEDIMLSTEDFQESTKNAQSAVEAIDDKFNTVEDKIENIRKTLTEYVAFMQEKLGIGFSDVVKGIGVLLGVVGGSFSIANIGSRVLQLFGGAAGTTAGTTAAIGTAEGTAAAIGTAGTTAGTTAAIGTAEGTAAAIGTAGTGIGTTAGEVGAVAGGTAAGGATIGGGWIAAIIAAVVATIAISGYSIFDGIKSLNSDESSNAEKAISKWQIGTGAATLASPLLGAFGPLGPIALFGGLGGSIGLAGAKHLYKNGYYGSNDEYLDQIESTLEEENKSRKDQYDTMKYLFDQTNNIEEQRRILEESGLFTREELQNTSDDQLSRLVDSYGAAADAMSTTTDRILGIADKYYDSKVEDELAQLKHDMDTIYDEDTRESLANAVSDNITNKKLKKKISKFLSDGEITDKEWNKIQRYMNTSTDASTMIGDMYDVMGIERSITSNAEKDSVVSLYSAWANAYNRDSAKSAWDNIKNSEYYDTIMDIYGDDIEEVRGIRGYAVGSNYIDSDQLALLHEGEAVVPKKYNPTANNTELEMLRNYYKESMNNNNSANSAQLSEVTELVSSIKEILQLWRDDNARNARNSRFQRNSEYVSNYLT